MNDDGIAVEALGLRVLDGLPEDGGPVVGAGGEGGGRGQGGPGDGGRGPALPHHRGAGEGGDLGVHKVGGEVGLQAPPWGGAKVRGNKHN